MPPTNDSFTPNDVWASTPGSSVEVELTLPSGQTCRAVRLGIETLLQAGVLTESDALTGLVDQKHIRKVRGAKGVADHDEVDTTSMMKDTKAMTSIITVADRALPLIVKSPTVMLHYEMITVGKTTVQKMIPESKRDEIRVELGNVGFTDQIGFEDKMFLFEWAVGSLTNLATFRGEPTADVGSVAVEPSSPMPTKRSARNKR
jgi:hypothetical protein